MLKVDLPIVRCRSHAPRVPSLGIYDDPGPEKWIRTSTWCRTHRGSLKWKRRISGDHAWLEGRAPPTGAYLPFGAGPRACIGQQASLLIATLAVAQMARSAHHEEDDAFSEDGFGLEPEESCTG